MYIGEGYMNKEIVIEGGTTEDFINVITLSYEDFFYHNPIFRIYETISALFRPFQQINRLVQSKKNVAHHYDLNEDLYRLMLDKDMQYLNINWRGIFHLRILLLLLSSLILSIKKVLADTSEQGE